MTEQYLNDTINVPGVRRVFPLTELAVDAATTAVEPVFATLPGMVQSIVTQGGPLEIIFSASVTSPGLVGVIFRVTIDGVPVISRGTIAVLGIAGAVAFDITRSLAQGPHVVDVEWAKPAGTAPATLISVPAATLPGSFGASLLLKELANQP